MVCFHTLQCAWFESGCTNFNQNLQRKKVKLFEKTKIDIASSPKIFLTLPANEKGMSTELVTSAFTNLLNYAYCPNKHIGVYLGAQG